MWDMQNGVPGSGDYPLLYNTAYAIELNAKLVLPQWNNKEVRVMLEEQGCLRHKGYIISMGARKSLFLFRGRRGI
jgi:hypothetical protein